MKLLCYVNHYFGTGVGFRGKSTDSNNTRRRAIVEQCIEQLRGMGEIDVRVCGIPGCTLVPIDLEFPQIRETPTHLVYESLANMAQQVKDYDYFINLEDDIFLPSQTLMNSIEFDRTSCLNEVLHPNRLESSQSGSKYCVDIEASRRWTRQHRRWQGHELRVALNPHSGILLLSREKMKYALQNIDIAYREVFMPHAMESAFAHFLSPFCLYRSYSDLDFHYIIHLDRWFESETVIQPLSPSKSPWRRRAKRLAKDWLPPIAVRAWSRMRNED